MKALIIDDEVDLCLLLKSYLQKKGYDVMLAHSLNDGLKKLSDYLPAILFLDNNLPDGLGWLHAPAIASSHPELHQYLLSAYHPQVPLMPHGATFTVLEKPISFADLEGRIASGTSHTGNII